MMLVSLVIPLFLRKVKITLYLLGQCQKIKGVEVPLNITADVAYPLLPWVIKPVADNGNLLQEKCHFNYRLSHARMFAENTFGRLRARR